MTADDAPSPNDRATRGALSERIELTVNGMPWLWDLARGKLDLYGQRSVAFGAVSSLDRLIRPLREELGDELFRLLVALSSREGAQQYYENLISHYGSNFEEGFLAWGEAVAAAGWGRFSLPKFERGRCQAIVRVDNPWELEMQTPDQCWGCPFLQGKLIGIFSEVFGVTCWAYERELLQGEDLSSIEFHIAPSDKTIATELAGLRAVQKRIRDGELAREVERKTAALRESEARQRAVLSSLSDLVVTVDVDLNIDEYLPPKDEIAVFPASEGVVGRPIQEVLGELLHHTLERALSASEGEPGSLELELELDGVLRHYEARFAPRQTRAQVCDGLTVVVRDFTRQRAIEVQLHQAQKMESIGLLASGIGHDFNNLLNAIVNATDLLDMQISEELREHTRTVFGASEAAVTMIRKLLDFSRSGPTPTQTIDLHALIRKSADLLAASVGPTISVIVHLEAEGFLVRGDENSLLNALINLGVNARDAMEGHGEIRISTTDRILDVDHCSSAAVELSPGPYIEIAVRDTGVGMDKRTLARAFDPFFTTKAAGKGTGLGLAGVYTSVREHRGEVEVASTVGKGTTFWLRLPVDKRLFEHD